MRRSLFMIYFTSYLIYLEYIVRYLYKGDYTCCDFLFAILQTNPLSEKRSALKKQKNKKKKKK